MGKKPIVSVTYENERISIKKTQLNLHRMCVTSLLGGPWPIYGVFMGCTVNGFLYREKTVYSTTH